MNERGMSKRRLYVPPLQCSVKPGAKFQKTEYEEYARYEEIESWRVQATKRLQALAHEQWLREEVARMIGDRYIRAGPLDSGSLSLLLKLPLVEQYTIVTRAFEAAFVDTSDFDEVLRDSLPNARGATDRYLKRAETKATRVGRPTPRPSAMAPPPPPNPRANERELSNAYVPVPRDILPEVIGKQSAMIRKIREESGVSTIDAGITQTTDPVQVYLVGSSHSIELAKQMILEVVDEALHAPVIWVAKKKLEMVMGLEGCNMGRIQQQTSTEIDADWSTDPIQVNIAGAKENIAQVRQLISASLSDVEKSEPVVLEFPHENFSVIRGKNGSTIKHLRRKTGAWVQVDAEDGDCCRVHIRGTGKAIIDATNMLYSIIDSSC